MTAPPTRPLLFFAGLGTWAVVAASAGDVLEGKLAIPWVVALALFAAAFVRATAFASASLRLLALQSVSAAVVVATSPSSMASALFAVTAGQAPFLVPLRVALAWVAVQAAIMCAIYMERWGLGPGALVGASLFAFQAFAVGAATLAQREASARLLLAQTNAELRATRELAADATRVAERLRIARELHDSLGHHLTALSLHLEIARNVVEGRAKEPVDRAHGLAKELLGELRDVVGAMREDEPMGLGRALGLLAGGVPAPRIHVDLPPSLVVRDHAVAHALFRCAQEAVTNAVRHAAARNVWISVSETRTGELTMVARDDGRGVGELVLGNGLAGLRERVESIGGRFEIAAQRGAGVTLRAIIPTRGEAAHP